MSETHGAGAISKDGKICLRLLKQCLRSAKNMCDILDKSSLGGSKLVDSLSITMAVVFSTVAGVFNPLMLHLFLMNKDFQNWTLVLYELLAALQKKLEIAYVNDMLKMMTKGPRLALFFERYRTKIEVHVACVAEDLQDVSLDIYDTDKINDHNGFNNHFKEKLLAKKKDRMNVSTLVDDVEGCKWWVDNFGKATYATSWESFKTRLGQHPDQRIAEMAANPVVVDKLLHTVVVRPRKTAITVLEWGDFLFSYGPGIRVAMIQMLASARSPAWFVGALTCNEAKCILAPYRTGTFMVRFSEFAACTWVVSYSNQDTGQVNHALVRAIAPDPLKTKTPNNYFVCGDAKYLSLEDLVQKNKRQLRFSAPNIKNFGPACYFRDFLKWEEANDMLENKEPGTFLLRFSANTQGWLVVAYVSQDGEILQSRIYSDPVDGFVLGGKPYKSISEMVENNTDKLKYPLEVPVTYDISDDCDDNIDETAMQDHALDSLHNYASFMTTPSAGGSNAYLPLGTPPRTDHWQPAGNDPYGPIIDDAYGPMP
eukprot:CAMPEP_0203760172 /NCGR_PEP_ID=MMETSP0098-20131031/13527_1 /ASSEMBLY_ACC=CAM_ASM_000208 /TAXON_ID=96639 /ORGANISM=" , Strain NY0313808BC1" /LENGTH=538 /DNA_ID=CAMNT_0050653637 /DNA_START=44 /DNA_END=1660 /DNA_ORIENTATION=-